MNSCDLAVSQASLTISCQPAWWILRHSGCSRDRMPALWLPDLWLQKGQVPAAGPMVQVRYLSWERWADRPATSLFRPGGCGVFFLSVPVPRNEKSGPRRARSCQRMILSPMLFGDVGTGAVHIGFSASDHEMVEAVIPRRFSSRAGAMRYGIGRTHVQYGSRLSLR